MKWKEDSYEKALRIYGSQAEKEVIEDVFFDDDGYGYVTTQVIDNHKITTYKKQKKDKKKVVYKL
ncbi:MAG: hypothetical protein Unbinned838contig1000_59 [Prokaryotic dsDNA virus sp.]|nr:MAG: hypothetical protein Unbinned838contig1000_59 [Prokaryotic dsDNA virus sp.]|tara:strand:- start:47697 stop:47891 length:195 start_codon:yes stop_codon:yes gene_type:complete